MRIAESKVLCSPRGVCAPCRLCLRFTPVEVICHADLDSMRQAAAKLVPPHFPGGADATPVAFAVSQSSACRLPDSKCGKSEHKVCL